MTEPCDITDETEDSTTQNRATSLMTEPCDITDETEDSTTEPCDITDETGDSTTQNRDIIHETGDSTTQNHATLPTRLTTALHRTVCWDRRFTTFGCP